MQQQIALMCFFNKDNHHKIDSFALLITNFSARKASLTEDENCIAVKQNTLNESFSNHYNLTGHLKYFLHIWLKRALIMMKITAITQNLDITLSKLRLMHQPHSFGLATKLLIFFTVGMSQLYLNRNQLINELLLKAPSLTLQSINSAFSRVSYKNLREQPLNLIKGAFLTLSEREEKGKYTKSRITGDMSQPYRQQMLQAELIELIVQRPQYSTAYLTLKFSGFLSIYFCFLCMTT